MEKFFSLPLEKQHMIIDAALKSFGTNGYKKTSVSDVANAAGISKAMVFHYFGTKKALYLYLIELCGEIVMNEINKEFDQTVTDFFGRIRMSTMIEISVMKKHPAIPSFLASMYFENDEEVRDDIKSILAKGEDFRNRIAFDGMDISKFKENIDLKVVMKMLYWIAEGCTAQLSNAAAVDYDALFRDFDACLTLLQNNFYKEEYV